MSPQLIQLIPLILVAVIVVIGLFYMNRTYSGPRGETIVRCRSGHLYTTVWVPFVSLKAIRLGLVRFQYCPVGKHWSLVVPVRASDLSDEDRQLASQYRDWQIP